MEGFINQVRSYFKQTEKLIKELHKNLIAKDDGQIYITPFTVNTGNESLRITGKGVIKNITLAIASGGLVNDFTIKTDNKVKIALPNIADAPYISPKYFYDGKEGYITISENIKFNASVVITASAITGSVRGHIVYTLD